MCCACVQDRHSTVEAQDCNLSKNHTIGAFVNKGSVMEMSACILNGNGSSGCEVRDRLSKLTATGCRLAANGRVGLYTHSAACAELESCRASGNQAFGILCGGRQGTDIGGGVVSMAGNTVVEDGKLTRHGGRVFVEDNAPVCL